MSGQSTDDVRGYCLEHDSLSRATKAVGDICQVWDSFGMSDWVNWSQVKPCRMVRVWLTLEPEEET